MKSIKFFLCFITWLAVMDAYAQPQKPTPNFTPFRLSGKVYTPIGTPIDVGVWQSGDWSPAQKDSLVTYFQWFYNNRLTYKDDATFKYNCHAYAWDGSKNV